MQLIFPSIYPRNHENDTKTRPQHGNYAPYSLRTVSGFFNVSQSYLEFSFGPVFLQFLCISTPCLYPAIRTSRVRLRFCKITIPSAIFSICEIMLITGIHAIFCVMPLLVNLNNSPLFRSRRKYA